MNHAMRTPGPWRVEEVVSNDTVNGVFMIADQGIKDIANCRYGVGGREEARANAAFIVRACNGHDQLVEVLGQAVETIKTWHDIHSDSTGSSGEIAREYIWKLYQSSPEMKRINAALTLAKGAG